MMSASLFPGQGSQFLGMGKDLADNFSCAAHVFQEIDEALNEKLSHIMWGDHAEILNQTINTQPALLAVSIAVLRVLEKEAGFSLPKVCAYVAGHSLGEYSALVAVGTLDLSHAARLLRIRGAAMQDSVPLGVGKMSAVLGLPLDKVRDIVQSISQRDSLCEVANDNSPTQVIISGHNAAVDRADELAKAQGAQRVIALPVSAPFHCSLLKPAEITMERALAQTVFFKPSLPIVTNVTAEPITDIEDLRSGLVHQVTGTVRWRESVLWMSRAGVNTFFELGAGSVLSGLVRRTISGVKIFPIGNLESIKTYIANHHQH
jgi:[acyl-carrier-protein] S-malonyltransferase